MTAELAKALAAFQAEMPVVAKSHTAKVPTKTGGSYSYTYAGLADVTAAAIPVLTRHGLSFSCCPRWGERGGYELAGVLLHTSGERLEGALPIGGNTPQEIGSALTYARRYLFGCMTGLVTDDDDDGAAAGGRAAPAKKATRVKAAPADDPWYDTPPRKAGDQQITSGQLGMIGARMSALNITDRDAALLYVKDAIGRKVSSRNDLTRAEASKVIDALAKDAEQVTTP